MLNQPENDVLEPEVAHEENTKLKLPEGVKIKPKEEWQSRDCPNKADGCCGESTIQLGVSYGERHVTKGNRRSCINQACVTIAAQKVIDATKYSPEKNPKKGKKRK